MFRAQIPKSQLVNPVLPALDDSSVLGGRDWICAAAMCPVPGFHSPTARGTRENSELVVESGRNGTAAAKATDSATEDTVVVTLVPYPEMGSASIDTSSYAGLGVNMLARSKSLMRVSVPASSLLAISEIPGVSFVRKPIRPHAQQEIWSEGGWLINAYDNYFAGVRGQGVKVAIVDVGFRGADEMPGEMPASWLYLDYTDEGMYAGDSFHGTACSEIIHDMAQGAELYLFKVGNLVDLENAKDRCIQNRVDIISHSLVLCRRDSFAKSLDFREDGIGRSRPHERVCVGFPFAV